MKTKISGKIKRPKKLSELVEGDLVEIVYDTVNAHDGIKNLPSELKVFNGEDQELYEFLSMYRGSMPLAIEGHLVPCNEIQFNDLGQIKYGRAFIQLYACTPEGFAEANKDYQDRFIKLKEAGQIFLK